MDNIQLSDEHMHAVNRQRCIVFQDDVMCPGMPFCAEEVGPDRLDAAIEYYMAKLVTEAILLSEGV